MGGVEGEKGRHMSLGGQKGGGVMKYGLNPKGERVMHPIGGVQKEREPALLKGHLLSLRIDKTQTTIGEGAAECRPREAIHGGVAMDKGGQGRAGRAKERGGKRNHPKHMPEARREESVTGRCFPTVCESAQRHETMDLPEFVEKPSCS